MNINTNDIEIDIMNCIRSIPTVEDRYRILVDSIEMNPPIADFFAKRKLLSNLLDTTKRYIHGDLTATDFRVIYKDLMYRIETKSTDYSMKTMQDSDIQRWFNHIKKAAKEYHKNSLEVS